MLGYRWFLPMLGVALLVLFHIGDVRFQGRAARPIFASRPAVVRQGRNRLEQRVHVELAGAGLPLVVDPVMVASSGSTLLRQDAVSTLIGRLFPLATVVTPNLPEAQALTGLTACAASGTGPPSAPCPL